MNVIEADGEALLAALRKLLADKNLVTQAELAERMEATDNASPGQGAKMVARAWTDAEYKALMLEDGTKAAEAMNIPMRGMPPLGVLENTDAVHNLDRLHAVQLLPARGTGLSAILVQIGSVSSARGTRSARPAGGVSHHAAGDCENPRCRLNGGLSVDGAAEATCRH